MARIQVPKTYDPGDMITLRAQFYDQNGVPADPTDVVVKILNPIGAQSSFVPQNDGVGLYSYNYETNISSSPGRYIYRFEGTGAVTTAEEKMFIINQSDFF